MTQKISRLFSLFKKFKFHAIHLIVNPIMGKPIWININGRRIWLNFDSTTYYHLLNSLDKLKKLIDAVPSNLSGSIIDGGANHGIFSVLASQKFPNASIYAIEPYDKVLPILKQNVEGAKVKVVEKALMGVDGEIVLYTSPITDQLGSVIRSNVEVFLSKDSVIVEHSVPAISLKTLVKSEKITSIAVMKLDVQGAEFSILENADEVMAITDCLLLEVVFFEETAVDLIVKARKFFPYHKVLNPLPYGADILFSKKPIEKLLEQNKL